MLRLKQSKETEARALLRIILADEELSTQANPWSYVQESAERELARVYFKRALEAREQDRWADVGSNAHELYNLARIEGDNERISFKTTSAALVLAAWNRVNSRFDNAKRVLKLLLEQGLEMLYDSDSENDNWAISKISDALLAVGDFERTQSAHGLLGSIQAFGNELNLVDFDSLNANAGDLDEEADKKASEGVDAFQAAALSNPDLGDQAKTSLASDDSSTMNGTDQACEGATQDTAIDDTTKSLMSSEEAPRINGAEFADDDVTVPPTEAVNHSVNNLVQGSEQSLVNGGGNETNAGGVQAPEEEGTGWCE